MADFFDTSLVTGISLVDANGNPLNATITFASGTDYNDLSDPHAPPVATPEPSTFVLLGTGLLGAAAAARRRLVA